MDDDDVAEIGYVILVTKAERKQITESIDEYLQQGKGSKGPSIEMMRSCAPTICETQLLSSGTPREAIFHKCSANAKVLEAVRGKIEKLREEYSHSVIILSHDEHIHLLAVIGSDLEAQEELRAKYERVDPVEPGNEVAAKVPNDFKIVVLEAIWNMLY